MLVFAEWLVVCNFVALCDLGCYFLVFWPVAFACVGYWLCLGSCFRRFDCAVYYCVGYVCACVGCLGVVLAVLSSGVGCCDYWRFDVCGLLIKVYFNWLIVLVRFVLVPFM